MYAVHPPAAIATVSQASSAVMRSSISTAATDMNTNVTPMAKHAFTAYMTLV